MKYNKSSTKFYNKRDSFRVELVRMTYFNSNIPPSIFYLSIGSEKMHLARNSSNHFTFTIDRMSE